MFSTATYIYKSHLKDLTRPKNLVLWTLASAGLLFLCLMILNVKSGSAPDSYTYGRLYEQMLVRYMAFCSAVVTCSVISAEIEQRTVVYMLSRSIPRPIHLLMRSLASSTFVSLLGIILVFGISILVFPSNPIGANPWLLRDCVGIVLGCFAYGVIFLLITLLLNRALMFCLLFTFGWETLVPNMPGDIYYMSILSHVRGFVAHPEPSRMAGQSVIGSMQKAFSDTYLVPPNIALMSLIAVITGFTLFSMWHFKRNEFTAREDAE